MPLCTFWLNVVIGDVRILPRETSRTLNFREVYYVWSLNPLTVANISVYPTFLVYISLQFFRFSNLTSFFIELLSTTIKSSICCHTTRSQIGRLEDLNEARLIQLWRHKSSKRELCIAFCSHGSAWKLESVRDKSIFLVYEIFDVDLVFNQYSSEVIEIKYCLITSWIKRYVSKETVVLGRWRVLQDKLNLSTGLIMWIGHRKEIRKLTFRELALRLIRSLYGDQFTLPTLLIKPTYLITRYLAMY